MASSLKVSEVAARIGVTADAVRYYERIGLIPEAQRASNGYRMYSEGDVDRLEFVKRAQRFGLHLDEIAELLEIGDGGMCPCGHTRKLLEKRLTDIEAEQITLNTLAADIREMLDDSPTSPGAQNGCVSMQTVDSAEPVNLGRTRITEPDPTEGK